MPHTPPPPARWLVVASRFNEAVVDRLVAGALAHLERAGVPRDAIHVARVAGAFELPQAVAILLDRSAREGRRPTGVVALGAVVRGETPHFQHVAEQACRGLMDVATSRGIPVGMGVLTCDTLEQAFARAGGDRGNKGAEAAAAALELAGLVEDGR